MLYTWNLQTTVYQLRVSVKLLLAQSCPTLCDPMDRSPPASSVLGILQARILEWVAMTFSRGSSQPRDRTQVSCIAGRFFTIRATRDNSIWKRSGLNIKKKWIQNTYWIFCKFNYHTLHPLLVLGVLWLHRVQEMDRWSLARETSLWPGGGTESQRCLPILMPSLHSPCVGDLQNGFCLMYVRNMDRGQDMVFFPYVIKTIIVNVFSTTIWATIYWQCILDSIQALFRIYSS